jgi:hypothetical protein
LQTIWARAEVLGETVVLLVISPVPMSSIRKFINDSRTLKYACKFSIFVSAMKLCEHTYEESRYQE